MRYQRWNVDEIGEKWAKIVGISFYCRKTILVVGSKSRWIMIIGSSYSRCVGLIVIGSYPDSIWAIKCTTKWPLELRRDLSCQINTRELTTIGLVQQGRDDFFSKKLQQLTIYCTFHLLIAKTGNFAKPWRLF